MVSLEQIRKLEAKVTQAVATILELREENNTLRNKLESYQEKIDQLELLVTQFRESQKEIEEGILNALRQLDHLEDDALQASSPSSPAPFPDTSNPEEDPEDIEGKPVLPSSDKQEKSKGELDIF